MHVMAGLRAVAGVVLFQMTVGGGAIAQERLPWQTQPQTESVDPYAPDARNEDARARRYDPPRYDSRADNGSAASRSGSRGAYREPARRYAAPAPTYRPRPYVPAPRNDGSYQQQPYQGDSYRGPPRRYDPQRPDSRYDRETYRDPRPNDPRPNGADDRQSYSQSEVISAGHRFFGKLSKGLAKAIEYAFQSQGRPSGYILGEDAGGAFIAGLRYGEGFLHTKYGDRRRVFWQGPSVGYDFGGEGSRVMVLVYNLNRPGQLFRRFGGVQGSAYLVGGASLQILKSDHVTLAPIRTGVGLRLGANIGYLKFTRRATWNPF